MELSRGKTDGELEEAIGGTSLVVQWLRIHLAIQGVWVPSLVRELRPHMGSHMVGATKFVCQTTEPVLQSQGATTTEPTCGKY